MSLLQARARLALRRLGPLGLAGLVLGLGAAGYAASGIAPLEERIATLQSDIRRAETAARSRRASKAPQPSSTSEQLAAFYAKLPPVEDAIALVAKLNEAAVAADLKLQSAEYRLVADPAGRIARYQVSLPVTGPYPQIRKFVAGMLRAVPTASLDEIVLKRDSIQSARLEAQVKLTVFLRIAP